MNAGHLWTFLFDRGQFKIVKLGSEHLLLCDWRSLVQSTTVVQSTVVERFTPW